MQRPKSIPDSRTPQACEVCRKRKTKCDGARPTCRSCLKRKSRCTWPKSLVAGNYSALYSPESSSEPAPVRTYETLQVKNPLENSSGSYILLSLAQLERLFKIFLDRHHDVELCSFLHKPTQDVTALSSKSQLLVTAIITLSALYISDNEAKEDFGVESASALSNHYAEVARNLARNSSDEPSVYTIQGNLVLAIRELVTWTSFKSWMYAGTAIRMAHALQLGSEFNQRHTNQHKEIRRRTFWACFVVDRLVSYSCNRFFAIDMMSVRIQLPCPPNTFAFGESYSGPTLDSIVLYGHQLSQLGILPFYVAMVKLWGDMAMLYKSGGRREWKETPTDVTGQFYQKEKAVELFAATLPPTLNWSIQNYKLHQVTGQAQAFINLNFLLLHSKCVMHQEYLPQLDSQYALTLEIDPVTKFDNAGLSLDHKEPHIINTCIESAQAITAMAMELNNGDQRDRDLLRSTFAANATITASAIQLWILYTQTCSKCPKDVAKESADQLLQIIKSWQTRWRVASAWVETLEMLYKLYDFSYGSSNPLADNKWLQSGINEDGECPILDEDVTGESGEYPSVSDGDGIPNQSIVCQSLFDKVRGILLNPLDPTNVKKQTLRVYCKTLWQYMWSYESILGFNNEVMIFGNEE
ncbi:hypothetical protein M431DRAFT_129907 [Trichoderma harzianum CBS 226.95]|uniref:Zn(2)-C6 fungal-type domain-containing protein n=1 Tax=Trichoderma harzianum CBS 226.95 TaxID=983964 RepID=A0A2T3ZRT7_TRIHA|nr:hypothetical protein M431DRAFT_129907 [Trichoderma harzianum CBS 226.95]PTB47530.1 hypothetical protein M431DRAFT_129907 [Trichoderma harzianum CBS 226.95]